MEREREREREREGGRGMMARIDDVSPRQKEV
jgi:hypothetical protein